MKIPPTLVLLALFSAPCFAQDPTPTPTPDAVIANRVGVNTVSPQVPLQFTVHYPIDTTSSEEMIRFTTPTGTLNGITHHPFQFYQRTTVFGNDRTDSVGVGFSPVSDPQGAGNFGFLFEDSFGPTESAANFELHLIATPSGNSGQHRPWTWTINRYTGEATVVTSGVSHFYGGGWLVGNKPELHINANETLSMKTFRHQADLVVFETMNNGGANAKQIRVVPHPNDSALSQLMFGDSNGVGLANVGGQLEVLKQGNPATINAGTYKASGSAGVTVSGSACVITAIKGGIITGATCTP